MVTSEELDSTLPSLLSNYCSQSGADARYWHKEGATWGIKFYKDEYVRDLNYERQAEAQHLGLAPRLGDKVDWDIEGDRVYGFITQHIRVAYWLPADEWKMSQKLLDAKLSTYDDDIRRRMYQDLHMKNWGIDENGEPLIIDFSRQESDDYNPQYDDADDDCDCNCTECRNERDSSSQPEEELP